MLSVVNLVKEKKLMDNPVTYVKLNQLVGETIKVEKVFPAKYKAWDDGEKKYVTSETPQKGFQKRYNADTSKGRVEFSNSQIAQMLEGVCDDGRADINGASFTIRSNGKTGMEIRYFINPVVEARDEGYEEDYSQIGF